MKKEIKSTIRSTAIRGITSAVITAAFMFLVYFQGWRSIAAGLGIGFFTYLSLSIYSDTIVRKYLRKSNLFLLLLTNTITNVVIMLVIAWFFVGLFYLDGKFYILLRDMNNLFSSYFLIGIGFGLVLSMFFNFFSIVNNLIGGKTLGKIFIGRYRNPVEIRQVFMFLDIKSSTTIAEKTGHLKFLSLVNDFFYDVAEPVRKTKGEIYKYVGDEAIITWKMKDAANDANCIRCFFMIQSIIRENARHYLDKYGIVPEFKAGLHGGVVVTGELGYTKREIAFMGDVVNTTARIEEECKIYNESLLVSGELLSQIRLPESISINELGKVKLRGKELEVTLFSVKE